MAEPVDKPAGSQLSARRQAILQALIPVVPSVSGDPDGKFQRIVNNRSDDAVEALKKSGGVTTCLDLIGFCAKAAGAVPGRHQIAGGAMQLQEPGVNLGGWVERVYDPSTDPVLKMMRDANKGAFGKMPPSLAGLKREIAGMKAPGPLSPTFTAPPMPGFQPFATPTPQPLDIDRYLADRMAEIRIPKPGDFFQIRTSPVFVKHVGVIVKVDGTWIATAEAGQSEKRMSKPDANGKPIMIENPLIPGKMIFKMDNKEAAKFFNREYDAATGHFFTHKSSDNGFLFGWIDVDLMNLD